MFKYTPLQQRVHGLLSSIKKAWKEFWFGPDLSHLTPLEKQILLEKNLEKYGLVPPGTFAETHKRLQDENDEMKAKEALLCEEENLVQCK